LVNEKMKEYKIDEEVWGDKLFRFTKTAVE
jgi:hypothetical protein